MPTSEARCCGAKIIGVGVHETGVVEDRAAGILDDGEGKFDRGPGQSLAADRLAIVVPRADVAEVKATQIVRATEKKPVEDRAPRSLRCPQVRRRRRLSPLRMRRSGRRQMEVLRAFQIAAVNLHVAAKETARDIRSEDDAMPLRVRNGLSRVSQTRLAPIWLLRSVPFFRFDRAREAVDIIDLDVLEAITEADGKNG